MNIKEDDMKVEINKEYSFEKNQFLWRYVDLHRLIYFLNTGNLFFSPLNSFFDPLEGIGKENLLDEQFVQAIDTNKETRSVEENDCREDIAMQKEFKNSLEIIQKTLFANCWYLGVRESLAMWDTYSNKDSVALKFEPQDLSKAIIQNCREVENDDFELMVHGKVEYFNISPPNAEADEEIKNCGHNYQGFLKDISYKHEEEFRFLVFQSNHERSYDYFELPIGDLTSLNFSIVTHPHMEPWKYNNILEFLKSKDLAHKFTRSSIPTRRQVFDTP
jgi:hypothetical protein